MRFQVRGWYGEMVGCRIVLINGEDCIEGKWRGYFEPDLSSVPMCDCDLADAVDKAVDRAIDICLGG